MQINLKKQKESEKKKEKERETVKFFRWETLYFPSESKYGRTFPQTQYIVAHNVGTVDFSLNHFFLPFSYFFWYLYFLTSH